MTGILTTIKLDPFYQQFLRGHFNQTGPIFKFTKGHDLLIRLEFFLSIPPQNSKSPDFGSWTFKIEIPYMEHKDPFCYNYISETRNIQFVKRIVSFFRDIFHEEIYKRKREGFNKNEIVYMLFEEYGIDAMYFDRVIKEYNRFMKNERQRRFKRKKKRINRLS